MTTLVEYTARIRRFEREDWRVYFAWVGLMVGLLTAVTGFVVTGWLHGVQYPAYVWNVPLGTLIFILAIAVDTIGHRTEYKEDLKRGEALVHHLTIFAGITSVVLLCLAYRFPVFLRFPALTMIAVSIFYSILDELMHWQRFQGGRSDRVEMWSHFFIFVGHLMFMIPWVYWFEMGYPGVAQTVAFMH